MPRRKPVPAPAAGSAGEPVLPLELVDGRGLSADEYADQCREKAAWLRAHGVDPGDWPAVHRVLKASEAAHGLPPRRDALARARWTAEQQTADGG